MYSTGNFNAADLILLTARKTELSAFDETIAKTPTYLQTPVLPSCNAAFVRYERCTAAIPEDSYHLRHLQASKKGKYSPLGDERDCIYGSAVFPRSQQRQERVLLCSDRQAIRVV